MGFTKMLNEDENISGEFKDAVEKKYYAMFFNHKGKISLYVEIKKEDIEDIISAVKGQYFLSKKDLKISGEDYSRVEIYC
jgi:uncharacterized protein (UPF0332 family)